MLLVMTTFSLLPITAVPVQLNELKIDVMQGVKIFLPTDKLSETKVKCQPDFKICKLFFYPSMLYDIQAYFSYPFMRSFASMMANL